MPVIHCWGDGGRKKQESLCSGILTESANLHFYLIDKEIPSPVSHSLNMIKNILFRLFFPTASCFYAWAHSMLAHHGETDLIIAILKVRKDPQRDDFMKVTQSAVRV